MGAPRRLLVPGLLGLAVSAGACTSQGSNPRIPLEVPNAVSGGTRGGGRPDSPSAARMAESDDLARAAKAEKAAAEKRDAAAKVETLYEGAAVKAAKDAGDAADDYKEVADDHPEYVRADEARYLSAVNYMADEDWNSAVAALIQYMTDFPANPHLREVERMLYDGSVRVFDGARGFSGIFRSDKKGFEGLNAIVERFPEGDLPDDALMRLGDEYERKDDAANAALSYKDLLLRFPRSELAPRARLRLGDTYLSRDQGTSYHAGYLDVDPRGPRSPQYAAGRPVASCVEEALKMYQAYLTEDRARGAAEDVAYAEGRVAECRSRLAAKHRSVSAYYAARGDASGAETYERLASNAESGRAPIDGMPTAPVHPPSPAPVRVPSSAATFPPAGPAPFVPPPAAPGAPARPPAVPSAPPAVAPQGPPEGPPRGLEPRPVLPPAPPALPPAPMVPPYVPPPPSPATPPPFVPAPSAASPSAPPMPGVLPPPRHITRMAPTDTPK